MQPPPSLSSPIPCMQGDVRKYEACEAMVAGAVAKFGRLDILVNCAAGNFLAAPEQLSSNGFRTVLEIDTLGTFNMCKYDGGLLTG